ncbi:MAG: DNA mismatch repair endonuclease MutL [Lachnospiraceae bacterium]|nr:DNA mismatch repair endonuclease MutL [Lachnospiraceae bacterium]
MGIIHELDESTINQIAAGEVIERPASVVKELVENAIDAGASAVTVEIRDGGISYIRITDNGAGIAKEDIRIAFLRHTTSKIRNAADLISVSSLGFRGEALSSIAAVSQVEVLTKRRRDIVGVRYVIEGGVERSLEEVGTPDGTTFIVKNLFYHTPARRKFLKTAAGEAAQVSEIIERIALSHPGISIRYIVNGQNKIHTSGNHKLKDCIYQVYGREIAENLIETGTSDFENANGLSAEQTAVSDGHLASAKPSAAEIENPSEAAASEDETAESISEKTKEAGRISVSGFAGKPVIARGNRSYEIYFVNGRYIKSSLIARAIEDAYAPYLMQHKYPLVVLQLKIDPEQLDVNVHPAKMEIRFKDRELIYHFIYETLAEALRAKPAVTVATLPEPKAAPLSGTAAAAEPRAGGVPSKPASSENTAGVLSPLNRFTAVTAPESKGSVNKTEIISGMREFPSQNISTRKSDTADIMIADTVAEVRDESGPVGEPYRPPKPIRPAEIFEAERLKEEETIYGPKRKAEAEEHRRETETAGKILQMSLFDEEDDSAKKKDYRIVGQVFETYWIVEYRDQMYIIDQHAAHEKILYERTMKSFEHRQYTVQQINPPIIIHLSMREEQLLSRYMDYFTAIGFEIEHFGERDYAVRGVPDNLLSISKQDLLIDLIDSLDDLDQIHDSKLIQERVASMSCKAAIKGNHRISTAEAARLIDELLTLDQPFHCPHGRPTIITMSKYEMEKKFKRIL